jgi:MinD superfamily P-loop ATPase
VVVLSGKGGTGKTTFTASMASFAPGLVIADCDVDAANLSLVLKGTVTHEQPFVGSLKAEIDRSSCDRCGKCAQNCHFDAIKDLCVETSMCEGCGVCQLVCESGAVRLYEAISGSIRISNTRFGTVVDAVMLPGEPNSGKLASKVRTIAVEEAYRQKSGLLLIDGPPGTGCPVISSMTGTDLVIIVTEPTASGKHDMYRVIDLARHFGIPWAVVVNKYDLDPEYTQDIIAEIQKEGGSMLGVVPYDSNVNRAIMNEVPLSIYSPTSPASQALELIWSRIESLIKSDADLKCQIGPE